MCAYRYHDNCYTVDDLDGAPPPPTHTSRTEFFLISRILKKIYWQKIGLAPTSGKFWIRDWFFGQRYFYPSGDTNSIHALKG